MSVARRILIVSAMILPWTISPPASANDVTTTSLSANIHVERAVRAASLDTLFNGGFVPGDVVRTDPDDVERIVILCGAHAERAGQPVRGVKIDLRVDVARPDGAFQQLISESIRSNRQGDAFVATTLSARDELLELAQSSDFWAFSVQGTNNKRIDALLASCTYAEVRESEFEPAYRAARKFFRDTLFSLHPTDRGCVLDTQNLRNGFPQILCTNDSWEIEIRDDCNKGSVLQIVLTQISGESRNLTDFVIRDLLTGDTFPGPLDLPTYQDGFEPGNVVPWDNCARR